MTVEDQGRENEHPEQDQRDAIHDLWIAQKYRIILAVVLMIVLIYLVVFVNAPAIRSSAGITMAATEWQVQSYADATGVMVPALSDPLITAQFRKDGLVTGRSGCNYYSASYATEGYMLTVWDRAHTDMFCDGPGVMAQESAYLSDLVASAGFRVSDTSLKTYDRAGKPLLVFVPKR